MASSRTSPRFSDGLITPMPVASAGRETIPRNRCTRSASSSGRSRMSSKRRIRICSRGNRSKYGASRSAYSPREKYENGRLNLQRSGRCFSRSSSSAERRVEVLRLEPVHACPQVVRIGAIGGLAQDEDQPDLRQIPRDPLGRGGALQIVRALFTSQRCVAGPVEPGRRVERQAFVVQVIDQEELGLGLHRPRHVDVRVPIEQLVQPGRTGPRRAADDEIRESQGNREPGAAEVTAAGCDKTVGDSPSARSTV